MIIPLRSPNAAVDVNDAADPSAAMGVLAHDGCKAETVVRFAKAGIAGSANELIHGRAVAVGAVEHPMLESHYITWIVLETKNGSQQVDLKPGMKPVADFVLAEGDEVVAAYEYCNLHGLWRGE